MIRKEVGRRDLHKAYMNRIKNISIALRMGVWTDGPMSMRRKGPKKKMKTNRESQLITRILTKKTVRNMNQIHCHFQVRMSKTEKFPLPKDSTLRALELMNKGKMVFLMMDSKSPSMAQSGLIVRIRAQLGRASLELIN